MKITESKNLKHEKLPHLMATGEDEELEPRVCFLESFRQIDGNLELHFKNGGFITIRAKNVEGEIEIDHIETQLNKYIGKSYEEILNINF